MLCHLIHPLTKVFCIQHALIVGDYKGAVNQCLAANRITDALVIAHAGGSALWGSTRIHYLKNSVSPDLKVLVYVQLFMKQWKWYGWHEARGSNHLVCLAAECPRCI